MHRQPGDPDVVRHDRVHCPHCAKPVDASSSLDGKTRRAPRTGDFALCFGCAEPSVYEIGPLGQVSLRKPTADERTECLAANAADVDRLRRFIAATRRRPR